jgi:arsenite methyltransferase
MSTKAQTLDTQDLERRVKEMYREVAEEPFKEFHFETGRALAERLGYLKAELDAIPAEAIDSFAGVGYYFDLAHIQPGETVVDLGSGSAMDSFLAALQVGESGRVIGIDITEAQLAKARRLAAQHGFGNAEFVDAHIEQLPFPDACADVVISNGVINLAPDKTAVFAEAARVLRPGGRLAIADIVSSVPLKATTRRNTDLWAACIAGAIPTAAYLDAISSVGFTVTSTRRNEYRFVSERAREACLTYGVQSTSIAAIRG